jgi:hypothetical protein
MAGVKSSCSSLFLSALERKNGGKLRRHCWPSPYWAFSPFCQVNGERHCCAAGPLSRDDLYNSHHALVFVIDRMTMVYKSTYDLWISEWDD